MFVTFCKRTQEPLSPAARSLVLEHCLIGNNRTMHLHAVVIMPEHVHLLLTPMRNAEGWPFPLKDILKLIKGPAARSVNLLDRNPWGVMARRVVRSCSAFQREL